MKQGILFALLVFGTVFYWPKGALALDWSSLFGAYEPTPLARLTLELQTHYRKDIDHSSRPKGEGQSSADEQNYPKRNYSVDFFSDGESGVLIRVIYRDGVDKRVVLSAIQNAKILVKDKAQNKYGLYSLTVRSEWKKEGDFLWTIPPDQ